MKDKTDPMKPVFEMGGQRIYLVNPGEVWRKGRFSFAPRKTASLIFEAEFASHYSVEECNIRDENTWKWLQELGKNATVSP